MAFDVLYASIIFFYLLFSFHSQHTHTVYGRQPIKQYVYVQVHVFHLHSWILIAIYDESEHSLYSLYSAEFQKRK